MLAIEEKAKELGAPIMYKPPKGTSSEYPFHSVPIIYNNGSKIGRCIKEEEKWHRILQLYGASTSEPWAIRALLQAPWE